MGKPLYRRKLFVIYPVSITYANQAGRDKLLGFLKSNPLSFLSYSVKEPRCSSTPGDPEQVRILEVPLKHGGKRGRRKTMHLYVTGDEFDVRSLIKRELQARLPWGHLVGDVQDIGTLSSNMVLLPCVTGVYASLFLKWTCFTLEVYSASVIGEPTGEPLFSVNRTPKRVKNEKGN